jgi:hypothetical protein
MHCITVILTSLISQALLQAELDKEERDFTGWFFQYEFLKFTSVREIARSTTTVRAMPIVRLATIATGIGTGIPGWLFGITSLIQDYPA